MFGSRGERSPEGRNKGTCQRGCASTAEWWEEELKGSADNPEEPAVSGYGALSPPSLLIYCFV